MSSTGLTWTVEHLGSGLGVHAADWDRLNRRLCQDHSLLDARFIDALIASFGHGQVLLARGEQGGELQGMVLLRAQPHRLGIWATFQPPQAQVGAYLLPPELPVRGLLKALPGTALQLDLLCNDPQLGDLRHLPGVHPQTVAHALTMNIRLQGSFDEYWALRSRKLIQNLRRYQRRLLAEHSAGAELRIHTEAAALRQALGRYGELESAGWKGREGTAISAGSEQARFYDTVMQGYGASGQAMAYELWLGDTLLASRLLLRHGKTAIMLKTAFSEAHDRFAPGRILLARVLEDLFERLQGGCVEFYTDAEADLLGWSTGQRWINHVSVHTHAAVPAAFGLLRRLMPRGPHASDRNTVAQRSRATVEVLSHPRDLPPDAVALMETCERNYMEFGADWLGLLCDTVFAEQAEVMVYVLRRQGRVLAVLPTVRLRCAKTLRVEVTGLANYYTTLFAPALAADVRADDLMPLTLALRQGSGGATRYRFTPMDPQAPEFEMLRDALRLAGLRTFSYFAFGNWTLSVQTDAQTYLASRSGEMRSTLRRMHKKLIAEGGRLEVIRAEDELERALPAYEQVYAASWKTPEPYPAFLPALMRLCARRGWLRLGLAWVGDRPVAAQLWMVFAGRAHMYKSAYDEACKSLAPGTLLTGRLMEEVIDVDQVREVDFLVGDDTYKSAWMTQRRERHGLVAYDPRTLGGLLGMLRQWGGSRLRKTPAPPPPSLPPHTRPSEPLS